MKKIIWLLPFFTLVACNKDNDAETDNAEGRVVFITGIEAQTRSPQLDDTGAGNFQKGDLLTLTVSENGELRRRHAYSVDETVLYWRDFGISGKTASFAGCYPARDADGETSFEFRATNIPAEDLLLARAVTVEKGATKVSLPFRHALHKLVVKYVADDAYAPGALSGILTTLRAHTICTVDLAKGAIAENSATTPADYRAKNGECVSWLVVPQNKDGVKLTVTLDGQSRDFTLPETTTDGKPLTMLNGGKTLSVTLRVSKNGITLEGTTIGKWEEQGSIDGEIEI